MAAPRVDRRLAAILAADAAGYSRLVQRDEQGTLKRLRGHRKEFIEPLVAEHHGRVVKLMGDGALIEFGSAVDAVHCAVLIQRGLAERESGAPEEAKIRFRIGINLGDVIHEDGDVYGDGVIIAARLEGLAEPGGICIARNIHNQVKGKLAFRFQPMGAKRVKNIAEPVEVWRVLPDGTAAPAAPARRRPARKVALAVALALVLLTGTGVGGWWWHQAGDGQSLLSAKPSIAVLPLANLSGDARWERLADGTSEDIITDLARQPDVSVIARNSTFAYKNRVVDVRRIGRELGVRFVLEGSLQASGDRVRVTTQLVDAVTGAHVWAARYDRPQGELFAIQDEITQEVVNALGTWGGRLGRAGRDIARRKPPASLEAYDFYLLGVELKHRFTKESNAEAIRLLARAIALDPGLARAWTALGLSHRIAAIYGLTDDPQAATEAWRGHIEQALALDPTDPQARVSMGEIRAMDGDLAGAAAEYERALAIAPSDADTLALLAGGLALVVGAPERAVELGRRAMRLNPSAPVWYFSMLGRAEYVRGGYREAIAAMHRAPPDTAATLLFLAMAHAQLGEDGEAGQIAARLRTEFPGFTVDGYIRDYPVTAPDALSALRVGAAKAGLATDPG